MRSEARQCKTVAIVSNRMPYKAPSGNLRYMYSLVRFLETRGHRVEIVLRVPGVPFVVSRLGHSYPSGRVRVRAPGIYRVGRWHLVLDPIRAAKNFLNQLLSLLPARLKAAARGKIFSLLRRSRDVASLGQARFLDPAQVTVPEKDRSYVIDVLDRLDPDAIFFDGVFNAGYCDGLSTPATRYVITHDVVHRRHATFVARGFEIWPRVVTREDEVGLLGNFDVVIAIQHEERDVFQAMVPDRDVITVPYTVEPSPRDDTREISGRCLFAGSLGLHNVDGLRWFLGEVWPAVISRVPGARFHVCGAVCEAVTDRGPGVVFRGQVSDLTKEYDEASLGIICLRSGGGLKIKIVEALSHGLPCVTTTIGAQGLERDDASPFVVADAAEDFADRVVDLLTDEGARRRLKAGVPGFCARYAPERVFADLTDRGF